MGGLVFDQGTFLSQSRHAKAISIFFTLVLLDIVCWLLVATSASCVTAGQRLLPAITKMEIRKMERREYLMGRAGNYFTSAFYSVLLTFFVSLSVTGCASLLWTISATMHGDANAGVGILLCGGVTPLFMYFVWRCWSELKETHATANDSYVPPVSLSNLPAEEILVRGAEEPTAPSEVLLRAAGKGEESKAEQLLRSSQQD